MFEHIMAWVVGAHPMVYFGLLMLAGMGMPISEDLLAIWAGSLIARGKKPYPPEYYYVAIYTGAVLSDMVAFGLGRLAQYKMGGWIQKRLLRKTTKVDRALRTVKRYGGRTGFIQRLSVGARLPICFFSGYSDISAGMFFLGTCIGALISLPVQLWIGHMLPRDMKAVITFVENYGLWVALSILLALSTFLYWRVSQDERNERREQAPHDSSIP